MITVIMVVNSTKGLFGRYSHNRDTKDTAQDILLLLYLLDRAGNNISGENDLKAKIKLTKLVFLAEKEMVEKSYKGFNFFYNIYKMGPSSKELYRLLDDLKSRALIDFDESNHTYTLTADGRTTIRDFYSAEDGNNKDFFLVIDKVLDKYADLGVDKILQNVYSMDFKPMHSSETINIGEEVEKAKGGPGRRLLMKQSGGQVQKELSVPENWIETINILMNPLFSR